MLRIDPLSPQDVTVHMSCPVQDDLEDVLEDCSRLRRLGHFVEAIGLFRDRLGHFLDNRYVVVQYAQCLYEAGQHAEVEKLAEKKAPPCVEPPDALQMNWDMLLLAAGGRRSSGHLHIDNKKGLVLAVKEVVAGHWPRLDSTEVRFSHCHRRTKQTRRINKLMLDSANYSPFSTSSRLTWKKQCHPAA